MWEKGIRTPFWLIRNGQLTSLSGKGDEMFRSILENGEEETMNRLFLLSLHRRKQGMCIFRMETFHLI